MTSTRPPRFDNEVSLRFKNSNHSDDDSLWVNASDPLGLSLLQARGLIDLG